ncbi:hypothetical protein TNCV_2933351 [Trichonephila clavipes]|nr:hypothetical protein TNCV_2933351 [Trichonephila clavipes]
MEKGFKQRRPFVKKLDPSLLELNLLEITPMLTARNHPILFYISSVMDFMSATKKTENKDTEFIFYNGKFFDQREEALAAFCGLTLTVPK